jgi:hypothetical protein
MRDVTPPDAIEPGSEPAALRRCLAYVAANMCGFDERLLVGTTCHVGSPQIMAAARMMKN